MRKNNAKEDLNQVSLTGVRAIVLLGLLIKKPRSLDEIRQEFLKFNIIEETSSIDILRIDINTLRSIGCQISRADHRTNNKYVLLKHPFNLKLDEEEVDVINRSFNKIKENLNIEMLLQYDQLFKKIALFIEDENIREYLLGISPLKKYNLDLINNLCIACNKHYLVKLLYKTPTNKSTKEKEIIADKIVFKSNKLYIYGIDNNSKESIYLNIKRIIKFLSMSENENNYSRKPVTVKFFLKDFGLIGLENEESILSGNPEKGFVIEGNYYNEFLAIQRILSFGPNATVLEPQDFRNKIIEILKKMRDVYND